MSGHFAEVVNQNLQLCRTDVSKGVQTASCQVKMFDWIQNLYRQKIFNDVKGRGLDDKMSKRSSTEAKPLI